MGERASIVDLIKDIPKSSTSAYFEHPVYRGVLNGANYDWFANIAVTDIKFVMNEAINIVRNGATNQKQLKLFMSNVFKTPSLPVSAEDDFI